MRTAEQNRKRDEDRQKALQLAEEARSRKEQQLSLEQYQRQQSLERSQAEQLALNARRTYDQAKTTESAVTAVGNATVDLKKEVINQVVNVMTSASKQSIADRLVPPGDYQDERYNAIHDAAADLNSAVPKSSGIQAIQDTALLAIKNRNNETLRQINELGAQISSFEARSGPSSLSSSQNPFVQSSTPVAEGESAQGSSTASNAPRNPFGDTQPAYRPAGGLVLPPPGSVPDDVLVAVRSQQQGNGTRPQAAGLPDDGYFEDQKRDIQQRYETAKVSGAVRPAAAPIPSFSGGMASGAPAVSADCNNRVQALGTKISSMNMGFSGNMVDTCRMSTQLINELQAALPTLRQCDPSGGAEKYVRQTIASWEPTRNSSCSMVETRTAGPTYSPTYAPPARTSGSSSGSSTSRGSGGDGYSTCNGPGCGIK